ncbi:hypothetical protein CH354_12290 [Leptospira levettii]|nr:hypothetical protein CH354_12290 [Leptospira levettii]PJZ90070.1 hypothetical protein CH368_03300 [Leptospira levettii]PKA00095.1 hypothetical protein CH369_11145 [Leptospira levettii]
MSLVRRQMTGLQTFFLRTGSTERPRRGRAGNVRPCFSFPLDNLPKFQILTGKLDKGAFG